LYAIRNPLYEKIAHHIVDTGNQPVQHIIHKIEKILSQVQSTATGQTIHD
jgi:shikimate kinase